MSNDNTNANPIWSIPNLALNYPGYAAQVYGGAGEAPGYVDPSTAMGSILSMYTGAGITGPASAYDEMSRAYMDQGSNILNAAGAGGLQGGLGTTQRLQSLSGISQGLAGLAGQEAAAQNAWNAMLGQQALGLGQAQSAYGLDVHDLAQQDAQFGATFGADQAARRHDAAVDAYITDLMIRLEADKDQAQRIAAGNPVLQGQYDIARGIIPEELQNVNWLPEIQDLSQGMYNSPGLHNPYAS